MIRAYKTELDPNNKQHTYLTQCAGVVRFVFNWALADRIEHYKSNISTSMYEQKRRFNALKKTAYPWVNDVPYKIEEQAFANCDLAFKQELGCNL